MQNSHSTGLIALLCLCCTAFIPLKAQDLNRFIEEGNKRFKQERYSAALSFYQQAESESPKHPLVLHHLAKTFFVLQNYSEASYYSEKLLKHHEQNDLAKEAYVILGSSLEEQAKKKRAMDMYKRGLKYHPDYFMLHFHLGLLYLEQNKTETALESFQNAVTDNPAHASSHLSIGLIKEEMGQRIPSVLAITTFLLLEPTGDRAQSILPKLERILQSPQTSFGDDDFQQYESQLEAWIKANPFPLAVKIEERVQYFQELFGFLSKAMAKSSRRKRQASFFWSFYGQLWPDMREAGFIESISHIILVPTRSPELRSWLRENEEKYNKLYSWLAQYSWN